MIYIERIVDDKDIYFVERQKDSDNSSWYGLCIGCDGVFIADNKNWINGPFLTDKKKAVLKELDSDLNKQDVEELRTLVKEAIRLGWFEKPSKV